MDRSEALELRKLFGKYVEGECAAQNVAGCVIFPDKSIKGEFSERLLKFKKETILKYQTLFKKILGTNNTDIYFSEKDKSDEGIQYLLDRLNATDLKNKDINRLLYELMADSLPEGMYAVLLIQYKYDIPIKSKNKERLTTDYGGDGIYGNESEEVYTFILAAVCPVKTDKASLGYLEELDKISENPQLNTILHPEFGLLFPNFIDRSSDADSVSCFRTAKLDISEKLFGQVLPEIIKPVRKKKSDIKNETTEDTTNKDDISVPIPQKIVDIAKEKSVPSMDSGYIATGDNDDFERIGITEEKITEKPSDDGMTISEVKAALSMPRMGNKPVKITGDKNKVEKRVIGGKQYWVIAVEDASVD